MRFHRLLSAARALKQEAAPMCGFKVGRAGPAIRAAMAAAPPLRAKSSIAAPPLATVPFPPYNYTFLRAPSEYDPPLAEEAMDTPEYTGPEPHYDTAIYGYKVYTSEDPFQCEITTSPNYGLLPQLEVAYETWGELNDARDNAVLIHTGLSASSHAHSTDENPDPGWWEAFIGPGKALDTNRFFIVCSNNLAGCYGTTGPSSINPRTGEQYGMTFPLVTVKDMVRAQFRLLDHLGIDRLHASVGASLGGMQSVAAASMFPERVSSCVSISASFRAHPTAIALRYLQRRVIMSDPHWRGGRYYNRAFPVLGMKHAREIATISYRSGPEWMQRFERRRKDDKAPHSFHPEYLIESYLDHQGTQACLRYDPNSLIYGSKAMDMFDLSEGYESATAALSTITCPTLVIGVQSDLLFPIDQQQELTRELRNGGNEDVTYYELDAMYGHDTFLIDVNAVGAAVKGHLEHGRT